MTRTLTFALCCAGLLAAPAAASLPAAGSAVQVELRTDDGRSFPLYPAPGSARGNWRVYAEASQGQSYRIFVRNRLDRRVGLVMTVDGRNIISGEKSWLKPTERMYVLEPGESQEYAGWRSDAQHVNRFFFTRSGDSYAGAFGDESAMGLIAVAVYPERRAYRTEALTPARQAPSPWQEPRPSGGAAPSNKALPAPSAGASVDSEPRRHEKKASGHEGLQFQRRADEPAGTGWGESFYAPSVTVSFEPESHPAEKTFIKYEWHETLCRLGVLPRPRQGNRLWDGGGFAPPPPGLR